MEKPVILKSDVVPVLGKMNSNGTNGTVTGELSELLVENRIVMITKIIKEIYDSGHIPENNLAFAYIRTHA